MKRLVKSTLNPDFEELRLLYSQSAFSNDGKTLAFTAQRAGKDVLYLTDVPSRKVRKRLDIPGLDAVTSPSFSPDDRRIVFSGTLGELQTFTSLTRMAAISGALPTISTVICNRVGPLMESESLSPLIAGHPPTWRASKSQSGRSA